MKWTTTTLFWLANYPRAFELTERSEKLRPIFTDTRGHENEERPRRSVAQFRRANHDRNRVRKPCANPLIKSGNRGESVRHFRAFALFAPFITSVCGGAKFSQALMFSSPLLLLRRKRKTKTKRKRITDVNAVETWKTPQKTTNKLKQKNQNLPG